ncbi:CoA-binding protein [uncultured Arcticibacterium sp.]|uniref:CoA-binding protein n=1 Tax=uncultured Arcticibacterium sp. TaxID=2173042 RepID=UPI0030FA9395
MTKKKTLILGASTNPTRYSYLAANRLAKHKHPITLLGIKKGEVAGATIQNSTNGIEHIHTVTMYLGERNQLQYEDFLLNLKPKRVIFNPGAENPSLMKRLQEQGVETLEACTLVMLGTGQF